MILTPLMHCSGGKARGLYGDMIVEIDGSVDEAIMALKEGG